MCPVHNGNMHIPYDTEKFYYGFPVYILAYPDEEVRVGITTGSSSYSLGQMVMIGCDSTTHAAASIGTSQTRWSVSVHSCAPSRSRCSPEMTQTTRPEIPTRGPRPRSLAGCAEPAYSSSVPAYFGCARFSGERMRSTSSSDRSSISWMTSRTVLPSAAARLPTTSPRWWPMTSLK